VAASAFLLVCKEPQRPQILDRLFKPDHGAGMQILEVEVGSDDQTTLSLCGLCRCKSRLPLPKPVASEPHTAGAAVPDRLGCFVGHVLPERLG
jgi:hypothetical protein